jgi:ATP-dependent DNA helicase RecG
MNLGIETEYIEFKKSTAELSEGIISISSILNKHGYGTIYFGVLNNGTVIGQQAGADTSRTITQKITSHIKPLPQFSIEQYPIDSFYFFEVKFSGTNKPYSAFGKFYYRHGDEDNEMTTSQLSELFIKENEINIKWNNELTDLTIQDIDEELLLNKYNNGYQIGRFKEPFTNTLDVLTRLNIIKNGFLTNSGKYLFSKSKPILLKLARFATNEKLTFLNLDHFYGNIFECIEKAMDYIKGFINWTPVILSVERQEIPEIPMQAIREIVVNSFVHSKMENMISSHEINIYPNRITIFSPGRLPYEINLEDFENGTTKSILINPTIAQVLYRVGTIEAFGTGFRRAFSICKDSNVTYSYYTNFQGFEFQFDRKETNFNLRTINEESLTLTQKTILKLLTYSKLTIDEMSSKIAVSTRTIEYSLTKLKTLGLIKREGSKKTGYWIVSNENWLLK